MSTSTERVHLLLDAFVIASGCALMSASSRKSGCSLFDSIANGGTGDRLFDGPAPAFESGPVDSLRVTDRLHIALVTLDIVVPGPLSP